MNDWQPTLYTQTQQRDLLGNGAGDALPRWGSSSSALLVPPNVAEQETRPLSIPRDAGQAEPLKRIMVIDDSPTICAVLKMCFTKAGFEVHLFADGLAFFRWLLTSESSIPDLLFLDLMLPKLDGYEIARRLNMHSAFRKTVIWLMSGRDSTTDRLKGRLVGARGYLIKPFQAQDALDVANTVLNPTLLREQ